MLCDKSEWPERSGIYHWWTERISCGDGGGYTNMGVCEFMAIVNGGCDRGGDNWLDGGRGWTRAVAGDGPNHRAVRVKNRQLSTRLKGTVPDGQTQKEVTRPIIVPTQHKRFQLHKRQQSEQRQTRRQRRQRRRRRRRVRERKGKMQ